MEISKVGLEWGRMLKNMLDAQPGDMISITSTMSTWLEPGSSVIDQFRDDEKSRC